MGGPRDGELSQPPQGDDLRWHQRGAVQHSRQGRARAVAPGLPRSDRRLQSHLTSKGFGEWPRRGESRMAASDLPLSELRIVEIGTGEALAYCGKVFADFGAEVIKVEPKGGDPLRRADILTDIGG